mmetsp:Transcript_27087/g.45991  ORF Transcript_27087/g.45991 Transcript_27087/m.45991 type:complete len:264 (+) Transcript_27087:653-1444(+)
MPFPVADEMNKCSQSVGISSVLRNSSISSSIRSPLETTSSRGLLRSSGLWASTSASSSLYVPAISSSSAATRNSSIVFRSICFRNCVPRPLPQEAPSMMPGMSATVNDWSFLYGTTPRLGLSVVKGYAAILGLAAEMLERSVDLPALGSPTRPTSPSSFSSSRTQASSPGSPGRANMGACRMEVLNLSFPQPPLPPRSSKISSPSCIISAKTLPDSTSTASVPSGTWMITSLASAPKRLLLPPFSPSSAAMVLLLRRCCSVFH